MEVGLSKMGYGTAQTDRTSVLGCGLEELAGFFRKLAADWSGWQGERAYESQERELRLTATHEGMFAWPCFCVSPACRTDGRLPP